MFNYTMEKTAEQHAYEYGVECFLKEAGLSAVKGVGKKVVEAVKGKGKDVVKKVKDRYGIGGSMSPEHLEKLDFKNFKKGINAAGPQSKDALKVQARKGQLKRRVTDSLIAGAGAAGLIAGGLRGGSRRASKAKDQEKEAYYLVP